MLAQDVSTLLPESEWLIELAGGSYVLPTNVPDGAGPVDEVVAVQFEEGAAGPVSEKEDHSGSLIHDQTDDRSDDQSEEISDE